MKNSALRQRKGKVAMGTETGKKHPAGWHRWEIMTVCSSLFLLLYIWIYYENFHFHVTHFYAQLGYPSAQHLVGQRYLRGVGVRRNPDLAAHWFSRAAQNIVYASSAQNQTLDL
ncbi:secretory immunoglobulin A-binding -like [Pelobates cultripes]|nr:secretory immunoglobulin A-binding -like [Pelobates cultripes]